VLILCLDTIGRTASAALLEDGTLLRLEKRDAMLDHSRTLLPLCGALLESCGKTFRDIDLYAVMAGPGSFTGIRIGMAAVKGFALAQDKPCAGISTLEAGAWGYEGEGKLCVTLRARGEEVFWALFEKKAGTVTRLGEEAVGMLPDLQAAHTDCIFVRAEDTAHAGSAALCAWKQALAGKTASCHDINPVYLKKTQAERMREEQNK
jgi:tRNA threonylcarbamoyladenosine biosynthesis protein TsaB